MKRYEYVALPCEGGFVKADFSAHRDIITQYAAKGYRYVGYIPTSIQSHGMVTEIDLIFEADEDM